MKQPNPYTLLEAVIPYKTWRYERNTVLVVWIREIKGAVFGGDGWWVGVMDCGGGCESSWLGLMYVGNGVGV